MLLIKLVVARKTMHGFWYYRLAALNQGNKMVSVVNLAHTHTSQIIAELVTQNTYLRRHKKRVKQKLQHICLVGLM